MARYELDLNGKWQFKEYPLSARRMRDLDSSDWADCIVPNSIFTNLIDTGKVSRFDIEANPEKYAWVSDKPWVYRKIFEVSDDMLSGDRIDLVCDGLDTIASVWLNEKLIAKTENMFIGYRFDVTKYIRPGENTITIKFDPAESHAKKTDGTAYTFQRQAVDKPVQGVYPQRPVSVRLGLGPGDARLRDLAGIKT